MQASMNDTDIYAIERPHPRLMALYLIRSVLSGPAIVFTLPLLFFRYHTLRYKFEPEGISMSWGLLFRKQVALNYSRIQDIHLESGIIQRWLGLADLQVQTASGNSEAEMTIEGLLEYEALRNFLYTRMRGYRDMSAAGAGKSSHAPSAPGAAATELELLSQVAAELSAARVAAEKLSRKEG